MAGAGIDRLDIRQLTRPDTMNEPGIGLTHQQLEKAVERVQAQRVEALAEFLMGEIDFNELAHEFANPNIPPRILALAQDATGAAQRPERIGNNDFDAQGLGMDD